MKLYTMQTVVVVVEVYHMPQIMAIMHSGMVVHGLLHFLRLPWVIERVVIVYREKLRWRLVRPPAIYSRKRVRLPSVEMPVEVIKQLTVSLSVHLQVIGIKVVHQLF